MRNSERKDISQEAISMEEYLSKRQKIKEAQREEEAARKKQARPGCGPDFTSDPDRGQLLLPLFPPFWGGSPHRGEDARTEGSGTPACRRTGERG